MNDRKYVLIAEDDEAIASIVEVNLKLDGFDVSVADDGERVLELIEERKPDLVILDVMMPKKDGWTVLSEIRRVRSTQDIPVIMLTALDDERSKVMGLRGGADDYVIKPFSPLELVARVRAVLSRVERAQRLATRRVEPMKMRHIPVHRGDAILLISFDDIYYIDIKKDYSSIHTHNESFLTTYSLSELEKQLDKKVFFRSHRAYIVNLRKVKEILKYSGSSMELLLSDREETRIPVSRRQSIALKEILGI